MNVRKVTERICLGTLLVACVSCPGSKVPEGVDARKTMAGRAVVTAMSTSGIQNADRILDDDPQTAAQLANSAELRLVLPQATMIAGVKLFGTGDWQATVHWAGAG